MFVSDYMYSSNSKSILVCTILPCSLYLFIYSYIHTCIYAQIYIHICTPLSLSLSLVYVLLFDSARESDLLFGWAQSLQSLFFSSRLSLHLDVGPVLIWRHWSMPLRRRALMIIDEPSCKFADQVVFYHDLLFSTFFSRCNFKCILLQETLT